MDPSRFRRFWQIIIKSYCSFFKSFQAHTWLGSALLRLETNTSWIYLIQSAIFPSYIAHNLIYVTNDGTLSVVVSEIMKNVNFFTCSTKISLIVCFFVSFSFESVQRTVYIICIINHILHAYIVYFIIQMYCFAFLIGMFHSKPQFLESFLPT